MFSICRPTVDTVTMPWGTACACSFIFSAGSAQHASLDGPHRNFSMSKADDRSAAMRGWPCPPSSSVVRRAAPQGKASAGISGPAGLPRRAGPQPESAARLPLPHRAGPQPASESVAPQGCPAGRGLSSFAAGLPRRAGPRGRI